MTNTDNLLSVHRKKIPPSDSSHKKIDNTLSNNNPNVGCGIVLIVLFFLFLIPAVLDDSTTTNTPTQSKEWFIYTVKIGDSLSNIANTYNVNISDIRNNEAIGWRAGYVGDTIYPGQEIQLFTQRCDACENLTDNLIRKALEKDQREKEELERDRIKKEKANESKLSQEAKEKTKQWEKNRIKERNRIEIAKQKSFSGEQIPINTNKKPKEVIERDKRLEQKIDKWDIDRKERLSACIPEPYRFISYDKAVKLKDLRSNYQPEIVQIFDSSGLKTSWSVYLKSSGLSDTKFKRHKKKIERTIACFIDQKGNVKSVKLMSYLSPTGSGNIPTIEFNDIAKDLVEQLLFNPGMKDGKPICMWVSIEVIISKRR